MKPGSRKILNILFLFAWLTICTWALSLADATSDIDEDTKKLKIIVGIFYEEDAEFFNEFLTTEDTVFTWGAKLQLLRKIKVPRILVSVTSIKAMKEALERLKTVYIDLINYNPERWRMGPTPNEETNNLVSSVKKARALARQHNVKLGFATDSILLDRYGKDIAPMVDLFAIQLQPYQRENLKEFRKEALKKVKIVKKGDKKVPVYIQVSMAPPKWEIRTRPNGTKVKVPIRRKDGKKLYEPVSAEQVLKHISTVKDLADGVILLYTEESRNEIKRLIRLLRQ